MLSNIISAFIIYTGNELQEVDIERVQQKIVIYITQNFSFHHTCLYIQVRDRENTPNKEVSYMIHYVRRRKLL